MCYNMNELEYFILTETSQSQKTQILYASMWYQKWLN